MGIIQAQDERDRYGEAGVDIDAAAAFVERIKPLARSTRRAGATGDLGGFGGLFDPRAAGFRDPLLVATTDGVGTKLLLAAETGRLRGLGIDLVAMCVNDLVVQGAKPLVFLDYFATGRLDPDRAAIIIEGIALACREAGCALLGGETAEMPGLYGAGHFDLAGFAVGAVERDAVLPRAGIGPGDVLLGLASSGLHSNGFSLVRLVVGETAAKLDAPAPFDPAVSLAEGLLAPTRLYVRSALAAVAAGGVKAMAHITGGGLPENLPRVLPPGTTAAIDALAWPVPPVFGWVMGAGGINLRSMARTFNMGIGLVLVVDAAACDAVSSALEQSGERVYRLGPVVAGEGPPRVELQNIEAAWSGAGSRS